jgi:hypothetical protein
MLEVESSQYAMLRSGMIVLDETDSLANRFFELALIETLEEEPSFVTKDLGLQFDDLWDDQPSDPHLILTDVTRGCRQSATGKSGLCGKRSLIAQARHDPASVPTDEIALRDGEAAAERFRTMGFSSS